jgi:hypothetical protein
MSVYFDYTWRRIRNAPRSKRRISRLAQANRPRDT